LAEEVITLSTDQGFPFWAAFGTRLRGSALAKQGQTEEGIAQMQQGLADIQAMGTEVGRAVYLADLAAAYAKVGRVEEGLTLLAEALAHTYKTGGRDWEAELYRLRGELTLAQSSVQGLASSVKTSLGSSVQRLESEAEEYFLKAIEIARCQSTKSWELRATMSLARLWQRQGKQHEARNMLSEIYNWFTEGFDTKDLQEAKALLDSLGFSV